MELKIIQKYYIQQLEYCPPFTFFALFRLLPFSCFCAFYLFSRFSAFCPFSRFSAFYPFSCITVSVFPLSQFRFRVLPKTLQVSLKRWVFIMQPSLSGCFKVTYCTIMRYVYNNKQQYNDHGIFQISQIFFHKNGKTCARASVISCKCRVSSQVPLKRRMFMQPNLSVGLFYLSLNLVSSRGRRRARSMCNLAFDNRIL